MARRSPKQLAFPSPRTWGGCRRGAGRKPNGARPGVPHVRRARHDVRHPVHVTLRRGAGAPSLRSARVFPALRGALAAASHSGFRVIHFSVQIDHVHLVVEADVPLRLSRGVQGLAIRCARAVNRCAGRRGAVWSDRFHARALTSPREVRHGMVYVLLNYRKHLRAEPGIQSVQLRSVVRRLAPGETAAGRRANGAARRWTAHLARHDRMAPGRRPHRLARGTRRQKVIPLGAA